jgi:hypothetical protein
VRAQEALHLRTRLDAYGIQDAHQRYEDEVAQLPRLLLHEVVHLVLVEELVVLVGQAEYLHVRSSTVLVDHQTISYIYA